MNLYERYADCKLQTDERARMSYDIIFTFNSALSFSTKKTTGSNTKGVSIIKKNLHNFRK